MQGTDQNQEKPSKALIEKIIGIEKLIKAALLFAAAIGIFRLVHGDVADWLHRFVRAIHVDPDNARIHSILERAFALTPAELRRLSIGSFLYGTLYLVEGIGLLRRKPWAEYLTIVTTSLFLPLEVYELYQRVTIVRSIVFVINVAIVAYLIAHVRSRKKRPHLAR